MSISILSMIIFLMIMSGRMMKAAVPVVVPEPEAVSVTDVAVVVIGVKLILNDWVTVPVLPEDVSVIEPVEVTELAWAVATPSTKVQSKGAPQSNLSNGLDGPPGAVR